MYIVDRVWCDVMGTWENFMPYSTVQGTYGGKSFSLQRSHVIFSFIQKPVLTHYEFYLGIKSTYERSFLFEPIEQ